MDTKQRAELVRLHRFNRKQVRDQDTYADSWGEPDPRPIGGYHWRMSQLSPAARRKRKRTDRATQRRNAGMSPAELRGMYDELHLRKPLRPPTRR